MLGPKSYGPIQIVQANPNCLRTKRKVETQKLETNWRLIIYIYIYSKIIFPIYINGP